MRNKCDKYQSLFIFGNEESLQEHLKICPECRREHSEMEEIASIVKEVKPFIKKKSVNNTTKLKIAASFIIILVAFFAVKPVLYDPSSLKNHNYELTVADDISSDDAGLPTDEYGLLAIE